MLLAVVGATGVGKSEFALDAVQALRERGIAAEIVNADALQLYRGMDIATAKLSEAERRGVPHHMLDVLEVTEASTVAGYQAVTEPLIGRLERDGVWPIIVGGSGLYVSAVLFGFSFPARDPALRTRLERELEEQGADALHERLRELDPQAAADIDRANGRRIVRAIEAVTVTGEPFRASLPSAEPVRPTRIAHLRAERAELVERLDRRVDGFWQSGLLEEVRMLLDRGLDRGTTARQAIGYAQALQQLRGELTQAEAVEATKLATRKYARRQVSWFKRYTADEPAPDGARAWIASILG
ncbi:tRNA (adenosine(37)-N6)-dimethylallyltransferase MiaA [uncultured Agrococcus sp.]|uniref:tRNA (adenosine(37)-N6)-dimethylallyltransferase MiaA n=1 Tax=uncultured Agrococcus sp. TaxID=382258 RepID=UPI0025EE67AC|nr:tRNA (adenosine(37)-N6)-dimethylallyltransferase MiaA [uncultured Agrococcus sp.]